MGFGVKIVSKLKQDVPGGQYLFTISQARMHKKSNGEYVLNQDCPGLILTLSIDDGLSHEEIYWINGINYTKLQKILVQIGLDPANDISKGDMIGKRFWGVITETITMNGEQEIKRERRLTKTWEESKGYLDTPIEYVIYKPWSFDNEEPAF